MCRTSLFFFCVILSDSFPKSQMDRFNKYCCLSRTVLPSFQLSARFSACCSGRLQVDKRAFISACKGRRTKIHTKAFLLRMRLFIQHDTEKAWPKPRLLIPFAILKAMRFYGAARLRRPPQEAKLTFCGLPQPCRGPERNAGRRPFWRRWRTAGCTRPRRNRCRSRDRRRRCWLRGWRRPARRQGCRRP